MTAIFIVGALLVVGGAVLALTSSSSRTREKPREQRASESIAVWTSSSEQNDDRG